MSVRGNSDGAGRADDIDGTLALTSRPGGGTRVEITTPLA